MKAGEWKTDDGGWQLRGAVESDNQVKRHRRFGPRAKDRGVAPRLPPPSKSWRQCLWFCLVFSMLVGSSLFAQYAINWHQIAGGGGISSNGQYTVSGTIGQPDAGGPMTGGGYSLTGGFWALVSVVQTPGAPTLHIGHAGSTVTVYWREVSGWNLVQSGNLGAPVGSWSASRSPTPNNGTNYLNITNPSGRLFFRLKQ